MNLQEAVQKMENVLRRKHFALSTEKSYLAWIKRFSAYIRKLPRKIPSEEKIERYLTALARADVSASTQNQAYNAIAFFYRDVLKQNLGDIKSLRAKRPVQIRHAPSREETVEFLKAIQEKCDFAESLVVRLLYGCGLRVTEPLNLRIRDVDFDACLFVIRAAKGARDRVVSIPASLVEDLKIQMESARVSWKQDHAGRIPVVLPAQLAAKYPASQFEWKWAWVFPARQTCLHPHTGKVVRWRYHEANIQRAARQGCRKVGLSILPHELRHAYATHCLNQGANPRALQEAMGHKSLETTMGYLHAESIGVLSPLDFKGVNNDDRP